MGQPRRPRAAASGVVGGGRGKGSGDAVGPEGSPRITPAGDIVAQLRSLLPSLAPAERRVGEVIVADPTRAAQLTITDLALVAETSETTVTRFCRSVGVGSYPGLRLLVATWLGRSAAMDQPRLSPEINPEDDLAAIVARIGQSEATAVQETAFRLDLGELERAIQAIAGARRIDAYGVGASSLVAEDLQRKLHRIGLSVWAWQDPHLAITSAANLGPQDVVVAISHSGRTSDTMAPAVEARERGARIIAVTNFAASPIAALADIVLTTVSDETTFRSGAMASRVAALVVVDCLFVGVAQRQWTLTTDAILRTSQAVAKRRDPVRGQR